MEVLEEQGDVEVVVAWRYRAVDIGREFLSEAWWLPAASLSLVTALTRFIMANYQSSSCGGVCSMRNASRLRTDTAPTKWGISCPRRCCYHLRLPAGIGHWGSLKLVHDSGLALIICNNQCHDISNLRV